MNDINFYGIILGLNFIISIVYIIKKSRFNNQDNFYMVLYIVIGIIFGGKYYTILSQNLVHKDLTFLTSGLSSLGSLIGSTLMLCIYIKQFNKNFQETFNLFIPILPLMYGIGKIGCFLSGCCLGFKYDGILSVTYNNISYFPVQLLESIIFIIIFIYINKLSKKQDALIISKCFIICGISKFLLEFLRLRETNLLNINQIVCIILILIGIILVILKNKQKN